MKKFFLSLEFLFLISILHAQIWAPIGAQWYYAASANGSAPPNSEYYLYYSEKDTVFANHACKKISRTYFQYSGNILTLSPLFTYQSGDTVFYFNDIFQHYKVLYDFNVIAGDTLHLYAPDAYIFSLDSIFRVVVDSISSLVIEPDTLKMVYTS